MIIGATVYFVFFGPKEFDPASPMLNYKDCAAEGQSTGGCVGCIGHCCSGLKGMAKLKWQGECIKYPPPGAGATCSDCGNGICDQQNNENECNCPEDCDPANE